MNKRLENIKDLIETDTDICTVDKGADCQMCGACVEEAMKEEFNLEDEARQNYIRDAYDWGR